MNMYAVHFYKVVLQEFCSGSSILKAPPRWKLLYNYLRMAAL